jgi:heat shock protein HslJ
MMWLERESVNGSRWRRDDDNPPTSTWLWLPGRRRLLPSAMAAATTALIVAIAVSSAPAQQAPERKWSVDCSGPGKVRDCRAVQHVLHRETGQWLVSEVRSPDGKTGEMVIRPRNPDTAPVLENHDLVTAQSTSDADRLVGRRWLAESIRGTEAKNAESTVSFEPGGVVFGSAGCNRFRGSAKIEGMNLTIDHLARTRMTCEPAVMDQEQKFIGALEATRSFRLEGSRLKFYDEVGAEIIQFT